MNSDDQNGAVGVQPPDGTTERAALTEAMLMLDIDGDDPLSDELGDIWLDAMHASDECMHPRLRGFSEWCGRTQAACKVLIERLPDLYRRAEARATVAEPSMSTTSPPENSGTDDTCPFSVLGDKSKAECIANGHCGCGAAIEGGAKP